MKKLLPFAVVAIVAIAAGLLFFNKPKESVAIAKPPAQQNDIVSQSGIHWHPQLSVYVKGQKQVIPANIGIGKQYASSKWYDPMMSMTDFHTHDNTGKLHWEVMEGPVTKEHVQLKAFFDVWGSKFNDAGLPVMTVNGQPNTEYENYQVKDKDQIELRYN